MEQEKKEFGTKPKTVEEILQEQIDALEKVLQGLRPEEPQAGLVFKQIQAKRQDLRWWLDDE